MASIARRNLFEDLPRFLIAQAGITFAVSLITIQAGILQGFTRSTALLIDQSRADLWVASDQMEHLELTEPLPLSTVAQAAQVAGVRRAEALLLGSGRWYSGQGSPDTVRIFGFDPQGQLFVPGTIVAGRIEALTAPYTVLVDRSNSRTLNITSVGQTARIRSLPVTVVGLTQGTQSIAASPFVFASLPTARAYATAGLTSQLNCQIRNGDLHCTNVYQPSTSPPTVNPDQPLAPLSETDPISYVLVQATPDQDLASLSQRLEAALPGTRVYTRAAMAERTRRYWQNRTGVGFVLGLGAAVGIIVGTVIVGQILYASVTDHLKEFGTLKAMGASNWTLYQVVLEQAVWMAALGYLPGVAICWGVRTWALSTQGILILMTPGTLVGVLFLTVGMCTCSAFFAIQKVTRVDPAIVFKA